jgi:calcineurin-like phosphoesterase family protein
MNETILRNLNFRVKYGDVVYHLGDFCFKGGKQGGRTRAQYWEDQINGKVIHIFGNHDRNNGTKTILTSGVLEFGNKIFWVQHRPIEELYEIPNYIDCILCGHVHEKWKSQWIKDTVPIINVGVDVWKFQPIRLDELLVYYDKVLKEKK